jgi:DNA polymerase III alpha subunit (gram-positive type)
MEKEKIDLKDWPVVTNGNDAMLLDSSYFVFDMEVTGMNPKSDKIVKFGYAIVKNGDVQERFTSVINPEIDIPEEIAEKIKISNDTVKGSPTIREVLPTIVEKIKGKILVAFNAKFCLAFLDNALLNNGFSALDNPTIDTYSIDIRMFPETDLHNLWHRMQHLGIAFDWEDLDEVKYETKILFNILDRVQKENPKMTLNEFEDWTVSKGE